MTDISLIYPFTDLHRHSARMMPNNWTSPIPIPIPFAMLMFSIISSTNVSYQPWKTQRRFRRLTSSVKGVWLQSAVNSAGW
jgi:hypothetical protein